MTDEDIISIRRQLLVNGYHPIPNESKRCFRVDWNKPRYLTEELTDSKKHTALARVERWLKVYPQWRATGVRLDDGLAVIDGDINNVEGVLALHAIIARIAPEIAARAPTRFGEGVKLALFCRADAAGPDAFVRRASRTYYLPGEDPKNPAVKGKRLEIFGGKKTPRGDCSKQFGVYGPHSLAADGSVIREYAWDEDRPALHTVRLVDLPLLAAAMVGEIIDAFDTWAVAQGWVVAPEPDTSTSKRVYDIDATTRFDTDRGGEGLTYEDLCDAYAAFGCHRCSSSFMAGRDGTDRGRCGVLWSPLHSCVAVHVFGDEQTHYPVEVDPKRITEKLGEALRDVFAAQGIQVPKGAPNWRERYVESGKPKASLHNTRAAIENEGVICAEDVFHNRVWLGRGSAAAPSEPLPLYVGEITDSGIGALRMKLSDQYGLDFTEKHVRDTVLILAHERRFNPVLDMLAEAEANWDGAPRLDSMAMEYFNCADTELARVCVRKTMIAAVARVRRPGIKFDTILTMEAPEGLNKSSAWKVLAGEENFSDESIIGKAAREVQEQLGDIWVHESADLAGMRKAEVETVKAFASRTSDRARPAYGHVLVSQPRHSIEVATTNADTYLLSQTGNRRFWPLKVTRSIDLDKLKAARLQLWGEAAHYQGKGESLVLPERLWAAAGAEQEARRVRHPWEDTLVEKLTPRVTAGPMALAGYPGNGVVFLVGEEERVATAAIFEHVLEIKNWQVHSGHAKSLADAMRVLGWRQANFILEGKKVRGYVRTIKR